MSSDPQIAAALAQRAAARGRLLATAGAVQQRLRPANLAQEAVETAKGGLAQAARQGVATAQRKPVLAVAIGAALGLLLARKPILRLVRRRGADETVTVPEGLVDTQRSGAPGAEKGKRG